MNELKAEQGSSSVSVKSLQAKRDTLEDELKLQKGWRDQLAQLVEMLGAEREATETLKGRLPSMSAELVPPSKTGVQQDPAQISQ